MLVDSCSRHNQPACACIKDMRWISPCMLPYRLQYVGALLTQHYNF